uniref:Fukutin n=1 Tax=Petromyzon marinus TaxID=7757 RepID=A0AAJ7WKG3_PETMA|nr:fukutin [Petromyzon marinus]
MSRPPPRVALATALAVAVATALLFLHLQLRLHGNASALGPGGAATDDEEDDKEEEEVDERATDDAAARETVGDFARVARSLGLHPTLVDPRVLAALAEADDPKRRGTSDGDTGGGGLDRGPLDVAPRVHLLRAARVGLGRRPRPPAAGLRRPSRLALGRRPRRRPPGRRPRGAVARPRPRGSSSATGSRPGATRGDFPDPTDGGPEGASEAAGRVRRFRRGARAALLEAGAALASVAVPHWLSSGTCLGWLRQCDVVTAAAAGGAGGGGADVDLGVWAADFSPALLAALLGRGFRLRHKFGLVEDGLELSLMAPAAGGGGVKLDVFFFYEEPDAVWNGGTQSRTGLRFEFSFGRFSLCRGLLLGVPVSVPCPPRPYVEANYGPGWRRPPPRPWDWKRSAFNVRRAGAWSPRDAQRAVQTFL